MKKLILSLLACGSIAAANAQAGSWLLYGQASVNATSNASNVPNPRDVTSTAIIDQYTNQVFVRCRGRQINFKISSDGLGVRWQLGLPRVDARPDGLRG